MERPRRLRWGFIILGVLLVGLDPLGGFRPPQDPPSRPRPVSVPVSAAKAAVQDVPLTLTALGAAQALGRCDHSCPGHRQASGRGTSGRAPMFLKAPCWRKSTPAPYRAVLLQAQGALKA